MKYPLWTTSLGLSSNVENQGMLMHSGYACSLHLYLGPAFSWFTSLSANSIIKWSDLEQQFHNYFFSGINETNITDLTRLKKRNDETVAGFIQRFREVRNKCYSLNLGDKQLAELAFQGLLPTLREKYASHDFESLSQLVSRISQETAKSYEPRRNFQKKVSYVDYSDSEDEDNMIGQEICL
jgi:hypothetical protein